MNYIEFGKDNNDVIILLHGGGLSWWNYKEVANLLKAKYHVILPILNGHAGSNHSFTSIEHNAAEIIDFIDQHFDGHVYLIGGLSLGGQVLLEILSQRHHICDYAIIESARVIPSKLLASIIKPALGSCYGLIKYRWFAKLQFKSLKLKNKLFELYFNDTCAISKKDMITFLQANSLYTLKESIKHCSTNVYICVGEKENKVMKKSAQIIHQTIPQSSLKVIPKLTHGEFSINNAETYAKTVLMFVNRK